MNKLLITTALVAFGAAPAFAQDAKTPATEAPKAEAQASADSSLFVTVDDKMGEALAASNLIGHRIYSLETETEMDDGYEEADADWNDIGEINDIIVGRDGSVEAVMVDVGGFLGLGEHQVALSMDKLQFVNDTNEDGFFIVVNATQDELENAPTADQKIIGTWAAVETAENAAEAVEQGAETAKLTAKDEAGDAAAELKENTDMAEAPADKGAPALTEGEGEKTAEAPADAAAPMAPAEGEKTAEAPADAAAPMAPAGTDMAQAPAADAAAAQPNWQAADMAVLTSEELTGAPVIGADDDRIGEVSELIIDQADGKITDAVLDIGGFLGLGEHSVAMKMDEIEIQTNGDSGDLRVVVNKTKEELEALPEYNGKL